MIKKKMRQKLHDEVFQKLQMLIKAAYLKHMGVENWAKKHGITDKQIQTYRSSINKFGPTHLSEIFEKP